MRMNEQSRGRLSALLAVLVVSTGFAADAVAQDGVASDRAVLEAFYDATDGPNWTDDTNWLTDAPLGDWYGVTTDTAGLVTRLELRNNGLAGSLPSELGRLEQLDWLDLSQNVLMGPIPNAFRNLLNLRVLWLSRNKLSGSVPAWLGRLSRLRTLYLSGNELTGGIPDELGNLNLSGLGFSWNELSIGPIPVWLRNHTNLSWLYLSDSGVTGGIPAWLGQQSNLRQLYLGHNDLGVALFRRRPSRESPLRLGVHGGPESIGFSGYLTRRRRGEAGGGGGSVTGGTAPSRYRWA